MRIAHRVMASLFRWRPTLGFRIRDIRNHAIVKDARFLRYYQTIYEEHSALLTIRELYNLFLFAQRAMSVPGDFAELGVYKGGSAWLVGQIKDDRPLHLFDTFEGLPDVDSSRDTHHRRADFADTSLTTVRLRLEGVSNVQYHAGFFPQSVAGREAMFQRFAFVHLDVDLYQSTLDGLRFFWPRLSPGGILISHDYQSLTCPGVRAAFEEFGQAPIPIWDTQAMLIKPLSVA
jgi:O-methyltransferase